MKHDWFYTAMYTYTQKNAQTTVTTLNWTASNKKFKVISTTLHCYQKTVTNYCHFLVKALIVSNAKNIVFNIPPSLSQSVNKQGNNDS